MDSPLAGEFLHSKEPALVVYGIGVQVLNQHIQPFAVSTESSGSVTKLGEPWSPDDVAQ